MNYALLVGINNYMHPRIAPELHGCINDLTGMKAFLDSHKFPICTPLIDGQATTDAITHRLEDYTSRLRPNDELIFAYSGHGTHFAREEAICPFDYDETGDHVIVASVLERIFGNLKKGARVTIIADCCYAGGLGRGVPDALGCGRVRSISAAGQRADVEYREIKTLSAAFAGTPGVVLFAACLPKQPAAERALGTEKQCHGVMTYYLLQELAGNGAMQKARTTESALDKLLVQFGQTPHLYGDGLLFDKPLIVN
jgi:uncharacterized caspase-like protein